VRRRARESVWTAIVVVAVIAGGVALVRWLDARGGHPAVRAGPSPAHTQPPSRGRSPASVSPPHGVPASAQPVEIAFTRDGDTLEANAITTGSPIGTADRIVIRLLGIDAPEMHGANGAPQCYARDAYKTLQRLTPNGSTAWVVADEQLRDQYERYLLYMWNASGVFVNLELARLGYVRVLSIAPNTSHQPVIDKAVSNAEAGRLGLWGMCVPKRK
jgi:micrococcal nuclease